jgi:hydrogenase-4 component B
MPILDRAVNAWMPGWASSGPRLATLVPVGWISVMGATLIVMAGGGYIALRRAMRRADPRHGGQVGTVGTWDCGYAAPTARMQYTASSFGQILVELFAWALRPHVRRPKIEGVFPEAARFESHIDDVVLDQAVLPTVRWAERVLSWFRFLQQGRIQFYILYVLLILVVLLLWIAPLRSLFSFSSAP